MGLTDLELALVICTSVLGLVLACTCCCWCKRSDAADAHIRTGFLRRQVMKAYFDKHGPDTEPAGIQRKDKYITNDRGMLLFSQTFEPTDRTKWRGLICFCHGFGDNISWMPRMTARHFAQAGFVVAMVEYEGHGRSDGFSAMVPNFDALVGDALAYFDEVRAQHPDLPAFLYGESMGGAVALKAHFARPNMFAGAVLCAPMAKIADDMKPPAVVVKSLIWMSQHMPLAAITPVPDVVELAFKDPERLEYVRRNPLYLHSKPRLATGRECLNASLELEKSLDRFDLPFLCCHGTGDRVTDPSVSQALYDQSTSKDKTLKLYEGMWHALHGGEPKPSRDRVFHDITEWLLARAASAAAGVGTGAASGEAESKVGPNLEEAACATTAGAVVPSNVV